MARNVIDALVVTLGLDAKKFTQGQREAAEALNRTKKTATDADKTIRLGNAKTTRAMRDTGHVAERVAQGLKANGQQGAEFFTALTKAGLGFLAVFTAGKGIRDFTLTTMTQSASLERLAENLGVATGKLSAWGQAVKQFAGGSSADAEKSVGNLLLSFQRFKVTGQPDQQLMLMSRYLGIPLNQLKGKNFDHLMMQLATKFHGMSKPQAFTVGQMMGFDSGTINLLEQGPAAVKKHLKTEEREGTTTRRAGKEMEKLQSAIIGVGVASEKLGLNLLTNVAPALIKVANIITDILSGNWKGLNHDLAFGNAPTVTGQLFGSKEQTKVKNGLMSFLMAKGLTKSQAAGFAGNAQAESSFNPNAKNGKHYGLFQWDEARRERVRAATGIDVAHASAAKQYEALWWELHHTKVGAETLRKLRKTRHSAQGSASAIDATFERSGDTPQQRQRRARIAAQIYGSTHSLPSSVTSVLHGLRAKQSHHVHSTPTHHNHAETHIGEINVHTQATNADGIASSIGHSVRRRGLAVQANGGLS